jgi:hypothetical protein
MNQEEHSLPSICIPRTFSTVSVGDIRSAFSSVLGEGVIERVDIIGSGEGQYGENNLGRFKRVFIHLKKWPDREDARFMRRRLQNGESINLVYSPGQFWRCVASRLPKPHKMQEKDWRSKCTCVEAVRDRGKVKKNEK